MTLILTLAILLGYTVVGGWTFGYLHAAREDSYDENGWLTPGPFFGALFWPITALITCCIIPAKKIGFAFSKRQLEKKRIRIELQEKIRIDLQEAEKALDKEFDAIEEQLQEENRKNQELKRLANQQILKTDQQARKLAEALDDWILSPKKPSK